MEKSINYTIIHSISTPNWTLFQEGRIYKRIKNPHLTCGAHTLQPVHGQCIFQSGIEKKKKMERDDIKGEQNYFIYTQREGGHVAGSENQPCKAASGFQRLLPTLHLALTLNPAAQLVGQ